LYRTVCATTIAGGTGEQEKFSKYRSALRNDWQNSFMDNTADVVFGLLAMSLSAAVLLAPRWTLRKIFGRQAMNASEGRIAFVRAAAALVCFGRLAQLMSLVFG
jgi:hypothetical protein